MLSKRNFSALNFILLFTFTALMTTGSATAAEVYKIGGIFSVTGRASFLGDPEKKTMEMLVQSINDNGGIDGRKLEAVIYDSEGDPGKAVMAISKLINKDRVHAIIGPSTTPTTLAVVPFAQRAKTPLVSCAAGIKITQPVNPWIFKTAQSDVLAVAAVYRHMKQQGIQKVGILTVSNAYGESGRTQLLQQADKNGITVVGKESFGAKDTEMTAQLTKIAKNRPDAIICWGTNPGPAVVARNVKQLNLTFPLYQSHGVGSPKFIELAGDAAENNLLPTGKILVADLLPESDPQKKRLQQYIASYTKKYNQPVSGFGGYAHDALRLVAEALKGSNGDKQKIRDNLENIQNFVGITGTFNFTPQDHNGLGSDAFVMVRIKDGRWQLLDKE
jgi:branched-chain amino acid transport system substrate-binding protein